jgi:hypothetical protein
VNKFVDNLRRSVTSASSIQRRNSLVGKNGFDESGFDRVWCGGWVGAIAQQLTSLRRCFEMRLLQPQHSVPLAQLDHVAVQSFPLCMRMIYEKLKVTAHIVCLRV